MHRLRAIYFEPIFFLFCIITLSFFLSHLFDLFHLSIEKTIIS